MDAPKRPKDFSMLDQKNPLDKEYQTIQKELKAQLDENQEIKKAAATHGSETIPEVWRHKETGEIVKITKYMYIVGGGRRVVFTNPAWGFESSAELSAFQAEYQVYENQHTTRV